MNWATVEHLLDPTQAELGLNKEAESIKATMEAQQKKMEELKKEGEKLTAVMKLSQGSIEVARAIRDPKYNNNPDGLFALHKNYRGLLEALGEVKKYGRGYKDVTDQIGLRLKYVNQGIRLAKPLVQHLYGQQIEEELAEYQKFWGL